MPTELPTLPTASLLGSGSENEPEPVTVRERIDRIYARAMAHTILPRGESKPIPSPLLDVALKAVELQAKVEGLIGGDKREATQFDRLSVEELKVWYVRVAKALTEGDEPATKKLEGE